MPRTAAGLLVWRRTALGVEVLLAHPGGPFFASRDLGAWTVPKGEPESGETGPDAARREFEEETGQPAPRGPAVALGEARQKGGKVNHVWAVEGDVDVSSVHSNEVDIEWPPRSGRTLRIPEIDRAEWFPLHGDTAGTTQGEAYRRIREGQDPFLDRLAAHLRADEGVTFRPDAPGRGPAGPR